MCVPLVSDFQVQDPFYESGRKFWLLENATPLIQDFELI